MTMEMAMAIAFEDCDGDSHGGDDIGDGDKKKYYKHNKVNNCCLFLSTGLCSKLYR